MSDPAPVYEEIDSCADQENDDKTTDNASSIRRVFAEVTLCVVLDPSLPEPELPPSTQ